MVAGVLIRCEPQRETEVLDALRKLEGLSYVYQLFGRYDMVALIRSLDLHAASEVVGRIRAIEASPSPRPWWYARTPESGRRPGLSTFIRRRFTHMRVTPKVIEAHGRLRRWAWPSVSWCVTQPARRRRRAAQETLIIARNIDDYVTNDVHRTVRVHVADPGHRGVRHARSRSTRRTLTKIQPRLATSVDGVRRTARSTRSSCARA